MSTFSPVISHELIAIGPALGSGAVHVFVVLAQHADGDGVAFPSVGTLAKETGMTQQSVRNQLQTLRDNGIISITKRKNDKQNLPNLYRIRSPYQPPKRNDSTPLNETGVGYSKKQHTLPNETIEEQSQRTLPLNSKRGATIPTALDTEEFRAVWSDYEEHRKQLRKPLTAIARKQALAKCERMGVAAAVAAVARTLEHGWTGIFEEHQNGKQNGSRKEVSGSGRVRERDWDAELAGRISGSSG